MKIKLVDSATLIADGNNKNFEMISYPVERPPGPRRQHVPVLQDDAGHVAQLVGHLESADRRRCSTGRREVSSQAERKKLFSELTRLLQDELPMVFIVHPIEPKAFSPRVQGYEPIPDGMMRFKDVWLR